MNSGIYSFEAGKGGQITLNFRFPKGTDEKDIEAGLKKSCSTIRYRSKAQWQITSATLRFPRRSIGQDFYLTFYQEQTGEPAESKVVGGGTYGRLMERGVAFGAMFPGVPDTMHQSKRIYADR